MEQLICKSLLLKIGLITGDNYSETLDKMFLEDSDNEMLLELQSYHYDVDTTFDILQRYWEYEFKGFSVDTFGKCLLEDLKTVYQSNVFSIEDFGKKCYRLWKQLPNELHLEEPFHVLSYADDPLSWGDEAQTREIYEKLFEFYK